MEKTRFYSEQDAQKKLDEDFDEIVGIIKPYIEKYRGKNIKKDSGFSESEVEKIQANLPEAWIVQVYANAFVIRAGDGENEEKPFFAPNIFIDFRYTEAKNCCEFQKSIIKRYPIGYCNCGRPIKPLLDLLALDEEYKKGGVHKIFTWIKGNLWYPIKFRKYPYWDLQVGFNMCEKCL